MEVWKRETMSTLEDVTQLVAGLRSRERLQTWLRQTYPDRVLRDILVNTVKESKEIQNILIDAFGKMSVGNDRVAAANGLAEDKDGFAELCRDDEDELAMELLADNGLHNDDVDEKTVDKEENGRVHDDDQSEHESAAKAKKVHSGTGE
jgi:hypothetical protein